MSCGPCRCYRSTGRRLTKWPKSCNKTSRQSAITVELLRILGLHSSQVGTLPTRLTFSHIDSTRQLAGAFAARKRARWEWAYERNWSWCHQSRGRGVGSGPQKLLDLRPPRNDSTGQNGDFHVFLVGSGPPNGPFSPPRKSEQAAGLNALLVGSEKRRQTEMAPWLNIIGDDGA